MSTGDSGKSRPGALRDKAGPARARQEADEAGVGTLVWHRHRPFHPGRLFDALEELCCGAVRSRGRFWLADHPDTLLSWVWREVGDLGRARDLAEQRQHRVAVFASRKRDQDPVLGFGQNGELVPGEPGEGRPPGRKRPSP